MADLERVMLLHAMIYAYGAVFAVALPHVFLRAIQDRIWIRILRHNGIPASEIRQDIAFLPIVLGCLERTLYLIAILANLPEFIGVWLAIKVAGGWKGWSKGRPYKVAFGRKRRTVKVPGPQVFTAYLIGAGLSVLFAVTGAYSIRWLMADRLPMAIVAALILMLVSGLLRWWAGRQPNAPPAP